MRTGVLRTGRVSRRSHAVDPCDRKPRRSRGRQAHRARAHGCSCTAPTTTSSRSTMPARWPPRATAASNAGSCPTAPTVCGTIPARSRRSSVGSTAKAPERTHRDPGCANTRRYRAALARASSRTASSVASRVNAGCHFVAARNLARVADEAGYVDRPDEIRILHQAQPNAGAREQRGRDLSDGMARARTHVVDRARFAFERGEAIRAHDVAHVVDVAYRVERTDSDVVVTVAFGLGDAARERGNQEAIGLARTGVVERGGRALSRVRHRDTPAARGTTLRPSWPRRENSGAAARPPAAGIRCPRVRTLRRCRPPRRAARPRPAPRRGRSASPRR